MLPRRAFAINSAKLMVPVVVAMTLAWPLPSVADEANRHLSIFQTPDINAFLPPEEEAASTLGLNLDTQRWGRLLPGTISFTARLTDPQVVDEPVLESYSPFATDDANTLAYTISAGWGTPDDRVTFSFTTRNPDVLGAGSFLSESQEDIFSLSRALTSNDWATTFTATLGNSRNDEFGGRTKKIGASASILKSTDWARRIGITAKIYQDWHTDPGLPRKENDTSWELRTGGDLWFGRSKDTNPALPSLSIFFSVKGNATDDRDADLDDVDVTTGLTGKVHF